MLDVCLILEGTYPYVAGGVSTWVHQLITAMKDIRFGVVCLLPHSDPTREPKYSVPPHVLYFREIYLHEYEMNMPLERRPKKKDFELIHKFYEGLESHDYSDFSDLVSLFRDDSRSIDLNTFFTDPEIWKSLTYFYEKYGAGISFLDFFWTWRGTHLPLLQVAQSELPQAKVYHAVSTGYAGLLGAMMKTRGNCKFFLTEHGIYTHERMLEITQANWIFEREDRRFRALRDLSFFKKWWISLFAVMSRLAYSHADRIFTLYEGNKIREVLEGAKEDRITIIPNGIDLEGFSSLKRIAHERPSVALIGRVVNIKDVKTYIQAARRVVAVIPDVLFYVIGPTEEEEEYYEECKMMVETLELEKTVIFTGRQDVKEYYPQLDVVVLTSISEAQPYVILEANICGVPVVATDVGACREMLEGLEPADKSLGVSGIITEVANPDETAGAILKLLKDEPLRQKMGLSGVARVTQYYDQNDLLSRYLNVYEQNI